MWFGRCNWPMMDDRYIIVPYYTRISALLFRMMKNSLTIRNWYIVKP